MATLESPAAKLDVLRSQLAGLHAALRPVLDRSSLSALTNALESFNEPGSSKLTGRLQSAQLQSSLAYVILDLVWILLKINGTDPHSHPVTEELKRVQEYLVRVHKADKEPEPEPEQRQAPAVDAQKAGRFIKGALGKRTIFAEDGSVKNVVDAGSNADDSEIEKDQSSSSGAELGSQSKGGGKKTKNANEDASVDTHVAKKAKRRS